MKRSVTIDAESYLTAVKIASGKFRKLQQMYIDKKEFKG
jgi:hypothetical protein